MRPKMHREVESWAEIAPPRNAMRRASLYFSCAAAIATRMFTRTEIHIPIYPAEAEQSAPIRKEQAVMAAIEVRETLGIGDSLRAE
jgi:hypothetical protein